MKRHQKGSILAIAPFLLISFFLLLFLVLNLSRAAYYSQKAQIVADVTLLSSLRMRAEALQKIADRWSPIGGFLLKGNPDGTIDIVPGSLVKIEEEAGALAKSLSGYEGRIKSIIKVVAEANDVSRSTILVVDEGASSLGISAEPVWLKDEEGELHSLPAGWYRRRWAAESRLGEPDEISIHRVGFVFSLLGFLPGTSGSRWTVEKNSQARLRWDVDLHSAEIAQHGNGGYPRSWDEALEEGSVVPFRFPFFQPSLSDSGETI